MSEKTKKEVVLEIKEGTHKIELKKKGCVSVEFDIYAKAGNKNRIIDDTLIPITEKVVIEEFIPSYLERTVGDVCSCSYKIKNTGSVRLNPLVKIEIDGQTMEIIVHGNLDPEEILTAHIHPRIPSIEPGEKTLTLSVGPVNDEHADYKEKTDSKSVQISVKTNIEWVTFVLPLGTEIFIDDELRQVVA